MPQSRGGCAKRLAVLIVVGGLFYGGIVLLGPWALHMGGRWTPFLTWHGSGRLHTKSGIDYPLYVSFFPSSHFSQLHREGLRPTGGVQGNGWLCTSRGVTQRLTITGTIFGGWQTTDNSLMAIRLLEPKIIDVGQAQGFFDLAGRWHGPELAMDQGSTVPETFRSGLKIEHASVTLRWDNYSGFQDECAKEPNRSANR